MRVCFDVVTTKDTTVGNLRSVQLTTESAIQCGDYRRRAPPSHTYFGRTEISVSDNRHVGLGFTYYMVYCQSISFLDETL